MTPLGCTSRHTAPRDGLWTRGDNDELGVVISSNGRTQVKARCFECRWKSGEIAPATVALWGVDVPSLPVFTVHAPKTEFPPCTFRDCAAEVTELHHFAPYNTFGDEAGHWPTAYLCRQHHHEWHRRMTGYRWSTRGAR